MLAGGRCTSGAGGGARSARGAIPPPTPGGCIRSIGSSPLRSLAALSTSNRLSRPKNTEPKAAFELRSRRAIERTGEKTARRTAVRSWRRRSAARRATDGEKAKSVSGCSIRPRIRRDQLERTQADLGLPALEPPTRRSLQRTGSPARSSADRRRSSRFAPSVSHERRVSPGVAAATTARLAG